MSPGTAVEDSQSRLAHFRHDLRTPINAILGYSEMLLEDAADSHAEFAAALKKINSLGRQLLDIVNKVLANDALDKSTLDELQVHARRDLTAPCQLVLELCARLHDETKQPALAAFAPDLDNIHQASERFQKLLRVEWNASESHADLPGELPAQHASHASLGTSGHLVLAVDDNPFNRDLLARGLMRQGHDFALACDGREALELLAQRSFDLVLLDIMMPVMDGFEVLARLKADPERKHIPVIMISAMDEIAGVVRCIEMGAEDYLPKPFEPVLLRARVGACLEKKRLRDQELAYLRNVAAVTDAAAAVEAGRFDPAALADVAQRPDQLGQLARVFQHMANEVQARVDRLQMQVQQLKVEIDVSRKAKQVAEITETDYFQELQRKAQTLRHRKS